MSSSRLKDKAHQLSTYNKTIQNHISTKNNNNYRAFWVSNTVEMFERMAYYAIFIVITLYLSNTLGFNDFEASMISGVVS